jgi:hypothetical protein
VVRKIFLSPGSWIERGLDAFRFPLPIFLVTGKTAFFSGPRGAVKGALFARSSQTLYGGCGPRTLVGEENGAGSSRATSAARGFGSGNGVQ